MNFRQIRLLFYFHDQINEFKYQVSNSDGLPRLPKKAFDNKMIRLILIFKNMTRCQTRIKTFVTRIHNSID